MNKPYSEPIAEIIDFKLIGSVLNMSAPTEQTIGPGVSAPGGEPVDPTGGRT